MASLVARALQAVLLLGSAVILARLLTPEDFGVFAMIVPVGIIASNVTNQCVQTALLQRGDLSDPELNGFFWLIVRVAIAVSIAMAGSGFVLAYFYDEPRVVAVGAAWAATLLLLVVATFQEALLKRDMRFPAVMAVQLSTLAFSVACSLVAAWKGAGYWALPLQVLVMEIGRAVGIFFLSDWRPSAPAKPRSEGVSSLRRAWLHLVGLRFSTWLTELPDLVAVGRVGGAVVLGHYDTARRWAAYAFVEPFIALTDVTLASLRHVQDDADRFKHLISRAFLVMLTISLPIVAFVAIEAETVVRVLLGPQWGEAVGFMRLLSIAAFANALVHVNRWIFLARGRTGRLFAWSLFIETPLTALAVLIGLRWGAEGVATGIAVVAAILIVPAFLYGIRGTPLTFMDMLRAVARPTVASLAAAAALAVVGPQLPVGPGLRLVTGLGLFGTAFLIAWHAMPGGITDTRVLLAAARDLLPVRKQASEDER